MQIKPQQRLLKMNNFEEIQCLVRILILTISGNGNYSKLSLMLTYIK